VTRQQKQMAERITVARILRPHGIRGEVAAEVLTDFPEKLKRLASAELRDGRSGAGSHPPRQVKIRSCWLSHSRGGQAIFHFEGSNSISDAEKLVGLEVQIPFAERTTLPSGSYYITDLIGCEVREKDGTSIGIVRDVQIMGEQVNGTPILTVDSPQGELLIPLAQEICVRVDTEARTIEVVLPEGLRDLNRNS
jgi:16S rRNA processing protein RimM